MTLQIEEKDERGAFIVHKIVKVIGNLNRELLFTKFCNDRTRGVC